MYMYVTSLHDNLPHFDWIVLYAYFEFSGFSNVFCSQKTRSVSGAILPDIRAGTRCWITWYRFRIPLPGTTLIMTQSTMLSEYLTLTGGCRRRPLNLSTAESRIWWGLPYSETGTVHQLTDIVCVYDGVGGATLAIHFQEDFISQVGKHLSVVAWRKKHLETNCKSE